MHKEYTRFLSLDVDALLEDPNFRAWALTPDVVLPQEHPHLKEAREILMAIRENTVAALSAAEKAEDFAALLQRVASPIPEAVPAAATRRLWPRWFAAAAAMVILLVWAGSVFFQAEPAVQYATGNGEMLEVELSDGTHVTLNANSRLTLPEGGWSAQERSVTLDGEAFFQVTKQAAEGEPRPFLVATEDAVVRVLGTRFNVRQRRGEIRVFLAEGAVKVGWPGSQHEATELLPGETVDYISAATPPVHKPAFFPQNEIAWTQGRLVFDHVPLRQALNNLSDLYGISFTLADASLETKELSSAGIPVDNREVALRLLAKALDLNIKAGKDNVYLVSMEQ